MSVLTIEKPTVSVVPQLAISDDIEACGYVNRWLHRELGTAIHAGQATFDPVTFYWHVEVELAYVTTGPIGVVGDVYLHAATGQFAGCPQIEDFRQRAEILADAHGME